MVYIGHVKIDLFTDSLEFKNITLSDESVIKALIVNRNRLDKYWYLEQNRNMNEAGDIQRFNFELDCLYLDLDKYIQMANLTENQKKVLKVIMYDDWSVDLDKTPQDINNTLNRICEKIKAVNDRKWSEYITVRVKGLNLKVKKCSRCGKLKPATKEYFTSAKKRKDGFFPYCKECNK